MAITLKNLISMTSMKEELKTQLIDSLEKMTEDQKIDLSNTIWETLAQVYYGKLRAGQKLINDEIIAGVRKPNPNDFTELEAKLLHEFISQLESVESEEVVSEVRQQLEKFKTQPMRQDVVSPPSAKS